MRKISILLFVFMVGVIASLRYFGPEEVFSIPHSIKIVEGVAIHSRKVRFLNHYPLLGWYSPREVEPTLPKGMLLTIDLTSKDIIWEGSRGDKFRVQQDLRDNLFQTYFFFLDTPVKGDERVTLRITSNSDRPAGAIHQNDWMWLREFYRAEVIKVPS